MLTSLQNPKVKAVQALHQKKNRLAQQQILIEGVHPVEEALKAGLELLELYCLDETIALNASGSCQPQCVNEAVMAKMATTDSPPPILAVAAMPVLQSHLVIQQPQEFFLVLVDLKDPGNIGTLIRSACAFGVTQVVFVGQGADPFQPKVIRGSAGLIFRLPLVSMDIPAFKEQTMQLSFISIVAATPHSKSSYKNMPFQRHRMLILGSEGSGLPQDVMEMAQSVTIPMQPHAESLNVGVAGSILLAEWYDQKQHAG